MEIRLAKTAGFCFGVKRAVDTVYEQAEQARGPIRSEEHTSELHSP